MTASPVLRVLTAIADLARLAVLVAVVIAALSNDVEGAARLTVVFLILLVSRVAGIPAPFDLAVCVLLPVATVASLLAWYRQFPWLDWVMHGITTGAIGALFYLLLLRTSLLPPLRAQRRTTIVMLTTLVGMAAGVIWEFYEWFAEIVLNLRIGVGYEDTIADLAMDTLGSILAGLALVMWAASGSGSDRQRLLSRRG